MTILFRLIICLDNVSSVNFQIENGDIVTKCDFESTKDVMVGYLHWIGAIVFQVIEDNLWIREQKKFSIRFTI